MSIFIILHRFLSIVSIKDKEPFVDEKPTIFFSSVALQIVIPFFSLLIKDLYFLNEGCVNRLKNGQINFEVKLNCPPPSRVVRNNRPATFDLLFMTHGSEFDVYLPPLP